MFSIKHSALFIGTFGLLLACFLVGCGVDVEASLEKAQQLENTGDYAGAAEQYEKILEEEPENEQVMNNLMIAQVRADPTSAEAWISALAQKKLSMSGLIAEYKDQLPLENETVAELLTDYAPLAPALFYHHGENVLGISSKVVDGGTVDTLLETAFQVPMPEENSFHAAYPDRVDYTLNGETYTYPYQETLDPNSFSSNASIWFSTPGTYTITATAYSSEYNLTSEPYQLTFTIPEDCVGQVAASELGGEYDFLPGVNLTSTQEGSTIYYTLDGTDPVVWEESGLPTVQGEPYTGYVTFGTGTVVLSARCVNAGGIVGPLLQETYQISDKKPIVKNARKSVCTDGKFLYIGDNRGMFRYNYDLTEPLQIYECQVYDADVLPSGRLAFCATPEMEFHKDNPYYMFYYENGDLQNSNRLLDKVPVEVLDGAMYIAGSYHEEYSDGPDVVGDFSDSANLIGNESYWVQTSGITQIVVYDAGGTNKRIVADAATSFDEPVSVLTVRALNGSKLLFETYYQEYLRGQKIGEPVSHFYVLDLATGERKACPELDAAYLEQQAQWSDYKVELEGATGDGVIWSATDGFDRRNWIRTEFAW